MHPLRLWMKTHPEFRVSRDARRVFGVSPIFLFRVLAGNARPKPNRAKEWEAVTGIPYDTLLFFNGYTPRATRHITKGNGAWRTTPRTCPTCQTAFLPRGASQRFCQPICRPSRNGYRFLGQTSTYHIHGMTPAEFAFQVIMERQGIAVEFIGVNGPRFPLNGTTFRPDFHVPGTQTFYEVSGTRQAFHANKHKYEEFQQCYPHLTLTVVKPDGTPLTMFSNHGGSHER